MGILADRVFHTEELNSYGFWLLTSGGDFSRFMKNPALLYMHNDFMLPVGRVTDLRVENGDILGSVDFDDEDEQGVKLYKKYAKGYMNGFSLGIDIKETSNDRAYLKLGQTASTVTKWELIEISCAVIPSNKGAAGTRNALHFYKDGQRVELSMLSNMNKVEPKIDSNMKELNKVLGLPAESDEAAVVAAITELKKNRDLLENRLTANRSAFLAQARKHGAVNDDNEASVTKLYEQDAALAYQFVQVVESRPPERLSQKLSSALGEPKPEKSFSQWQRDNPKYLIALKHDNRAAFNALYKAEFEVEPK